MSVTMVSGHSFMRLNKVIDPREDMGVNIVWFVYCIIKVCQLSYFKSTKKKTRDPCVKCRETHFLRLITRSHMYVTE